MEGLKKKKYLKRKHFSAKKVVKYFVDQSNKSFMQILIEYKSEKSVEIEKKI